MRKLPRVAAYLFNSAYELDDMTHFAYRLQICYLVLHFGRSPVIAPRQ